MPLAHVVRLIPQQNDRVAYRLNRAQTGTCIAERPGTRFVCIKWDPTWTAPPPMWEDAMNLVVLSSPAV